MEEHHLINPLAATHLLQHTLRSFCIHQNSQWVYAVFWRILPRSFPPPKWDSEVEVHDWSRGNKRNWILAWEDGFCNFAASTAVMNSGGDGGRYQGLRPEVFFKMSHEIHNYGEGLIGKVAANQSHKWIYKDQNDEEKNPCAWRNLLDSHPRSWKAQFQSGLETIALIGVREGVLQLGGVQKISEEVGYVMVVRRYMEKMAGFLLPYPSSISPSMASLQALLSKLPSVKPSPSPPTPAAAAAAVEDDGIGAHDGPPPSLFFSY